MTRKSVDKTPPTSDSRCGTYAGYCAHRKRHEAACGSCKKANSEHSSAWVRSNQSKSRGIKTDWYNRNKDLANSRSKVWEENNREHIKGLQRASYLSHRAERIAATAAYAQAHPEKTREYKRQYHLRNRGLHAGRSLEWKRKNPDKVRASSRRGAAKRKALKFGNGWEPYTEAEILELYGTDCHICGKPIDLSAPRQSGTPGWELGLQMDHVISLFNGGPDTKENVKPAHGQCNVRKWSFTLDEISYRDAPRLEG